MNQPNPIISYIRQYAIYLILALAAFLRFFRLDYQSLWMDEIYTLLITNPAFGYKEFVTAIEATEGFPYMYYFLLRGFYAVFGYSSLVARLPSAIAGVLAIYLIYLLVKHFYNKNAALAASILLAINEFHIHFSQEARSYGIYMLLVLFSFYRFSVLLKNLTLKNTLLYALSAALVLNISFFGAINVASQFFILGLALIFSEKSQRKPIIRYGVLAAALSVLSFVPNLPILKKMLEIKSFWIGAPQQDSLRTMFFTFLGGFEITLFIFGVIILYYLFSIFKKQELSVSASIVKQEKEVYSFLLLLSWFALFILAMLLKSYTGASVVLDRYFISILPVFVIVIAIGITKINNKAAQVSLLVTIGVFALFNLFFIKKHYTSIYKSQYREVSKFIIDNNTKKEPVYSSLQQMYEYYLNNDKVKTDLRDSNLDNLLNTMAADTTQIKPFWYADAHVRPFNITDASKEFLNKHFILSDNLEAVDAWTHHYILKTGGYEEFKIDKVAALRGIDGSLTYNIDEFTQNGSDMVMSGWAFLPGQDANNSHIDIILIQGNRALRMQTGQVVRKDVTADKKTFNLDNSGFSFTKVPKDLPAGRYEVGIYVVDKVTGKEALFVSDKFVDVP